MVTVFREENNLVQRPDEWKMKSKKEEEEEEQIRMKMVRKSY